MRKSCWYSLHFFRVFPVFRPLVTYFKDVMERLPVHLITARAALIGAASYGLESLKNHNG